MVLIIDGDGQTITKPPSIPSTPIETPTLPINLIPFLPIINIPTIKPVELIYDCPALSMTDDEIRKSFLDLWLTTNVPVMPYMELVATANIVNFFDRADLLTKINDHKRYLISNSNATIDREQEARVVELLRDFETIEEIYEEDITYLDDKIQEGLDKLGLSAGVLSVIGIIIGILIAGLVGFYFLKSFALEKGKRVAGGK